MNSINILTPKTLYPNSQAFITPIIRYEKILREQKWKIRIFREISDPLFDAELIIVDARKIKDEKTDFSDFFEKIYKKGNRCVYADTSDSTGTLNYRILPYVLYYLKNQTLRDISGYYKNYYGGRVFTDYYNKNFEIEDDNEYNGFQMPAVGEIEKKLRLGWNSGLANYYYLGLLKRYLYHYSNMPALLNQRIKKVNFQKNRKVGLSARMNYEYYRRSVAYQRKYIYEMLHTRFDLTGVPRRKYFNEIKNAKAVLSPFGWGEINYRDYEAFLAGAVLIKPDMSHLLTWPDLYIGNETYRPFKWDFSDLEDIIRKSIESTSVNRDLMSNGFKNYTKYIAGKSARDLFVSRFNDIFSEMIR